MTDDRPNNDTQLTLHSSVGKWLLILIACAVGLAIFYKTGPEDYGESFAFGMRIPWEVKRWAGIALCGVGVFGAVTALQPATFYLRLNQMGFTCRSVFRRQTYTWGEVESFGVTVVADLAGRRRRPSGGKFVGYNFSKAGERNLVPAERRVYRNLCGFDALLPDTYGMAAEELAGLMSEWKQRFDPRQADDSSGPFGPMTT